MVSFHSNTALVRRLVCLNHTMTSSRGTMYSALKIHPLNNHYGLAKRMVSGTSIREVLVTRSLTAMSNKNLYKRMKYINAPRIADNIPLSPAYSSVNSDCCFPIIGDKKRGMDLYSSSQDSSSGGLGDSKPPAGEMKGHPSPEQMEYVFQALTTEFERFFSAMPNYTIYHQDLIFEDNIRGKRTVGVVHYAMQLMWIRAIAYFKFAYVKMIVLRITKHPEDGTVRVRWQIQGIPALRVFFQFWKYNILKLRESMKTAPVWHDGFSVLVVGGDGLIHKHIVDKMQPDDDRLVDKEKKKTSFATKLALILGVALSHQDDFTS